MLLYTINSWTTANYRQRDIINLSMERAADKPNSRDSIAFFGIIEAGIASGRAQQNKGPVLFPTILS